MNTKERKLFHSRPLFYSFLALMLAIASSRFIFNGNVKYIVLVSLVLLAFLGYCIWSRSWIVLCLILSVFLFGLGWFFVGKVTFEGNVYQNEVTVVGRISDDVDYSTYGNSARVILKDVYIDGKSEKNISLTIYIDEKSDFSIGDIVAFNAQVDKVQLFTLGSFNNYYYRDGTAYEASVDAKDFIVQGNRLDFDEQCRLYIKNSLYESMGETNGAVAFAVLFGDKTDVEKSIYQSYKTAGIIHLLTVSGLHVGFLITLLGFILKKCRVRGIYNFLICLVCLGVYAYFCGFAPSIMRAGIMGLVLLATKLSGKCYDNLNTLGLAGIIILLYSPLSALDAGFLMSFFCVLGIFVISPWLTKVLRKVFPNFVAESFAISISAQIGILPFMANFYSDLNLLGFFINLIVIPVFSVIYPVLFIGMLLTAMLPWFSFILSACSWGLSGIYYVAQFFGMTNLVINLEPLDVLFVTALFVGLFLLSKFFMAKKKVRVICCSSCLALCAIFGAVNFIQFPVSSGVTYCFNYSNEMVILTNGAGQSVIVDVGYENFTKEVLRSRNVKNVSAAFILQKTAANIDTIRSLGIGSLVRSGSDEGFEEEIKVENNEVGYVAGFTFCYKYNENNLIGLEIKFDETSVFILKNKKHSEENLRVVSNEKYDILMLGRRSENAEFFAKNSKNSTILTYYRTSYSVRNFIDHGNIACKINGKKYNWRGID